MVEGSLFNRFVCYPKSFSIDFTKLNALLLKHVMIQRQECNVIGDCHFVTSIFELPSDFDTWERKTINHLYSGQSVTIRKSNIEQTKAIVAKRAMFAQQAIDCGYKPECVFHIRLQEWMLLNLLHPELSYQEKQVDTTLVALLVKEAIENPNDCFAIVAGDADILPAIHIAYPNYTKNVFPVLTSPNEKDGRNRQTSFKYSQYRFDINTLILQNHVGDIMSGNVYQCTECHRFFTTLNPISEEKIMSGAILPRCRICNPK